MRKWLLLNTSSKTESWTCMQRSR